MLLRLKFLLVVGHSASLEGIGVMEKAMEAII